MTTIFSEIYIIVTAFVHVDCHCYQARTQKIRMGVLIQSIVDPRHRGLGAPAVAYLTKDNPENPLLTHTAKKCN